MSLYYFLSFNWKIELRKITRKPNYFEATLGHLSSVPSRRRGIYLEIQMIIISSKL